MDWPKEEITLVAYHLKRQPHFQKVLLIQSGTQEVSDVPKPHRWFPSNQKAGSLETHAPKSRLLTSRHCDSPQHFDLGGFRRARPCCDALHTSGSPTTHLAFKRRNEGSLCNGSGACPFYILGVFVSGNTPPTVGFSLEQTEKGEPQKQTPISYPFTAAWRSLTQVWLFTCSLERSYYEGSKWEGLETK